MQKISIKKFIPGIAWFFVVLVLICMPGKDVPEVGWLIGIPNFDKAVHVGIFCVMGVLFCWPFYKSLYNSLKRRKYFLCIAIAVSIWGLTTEFIQKFYVPGRSFDLMDWAADSVGAIIAYLFCRKKFTER